MSTTLPFSQACENNKNPILEVMRRHLSKCESLLEIGGGTGQHAVHFASHFEYLHWQSTDLADNIANLNLRLGQAKLENLPLALALDVNQSSWPGKNADAIFTANTLHIMSADSVEKFFAGVDAHLALGGLLLVYGPFKYKGDFTTQSNAQFDLWLKARDPQSGVRDFEWVNDMARSIGLTLLEDYVMPANNQMLVWQRIG